MSEELKPRLILHSGRVADPLGDLSELTIEDLAWALAHTYRWAGMAEPALTVGQHTIAMARHYRARQEYGLALAALMHECGEPFFRDMPFRIKYQPQMQWYREQEKACGTKITRKFAPEIEHLLPEIKDADNAALLTELRQRFPDTEDRKSWLTQEHGLRKPTFTLDSKYYESGDDAYTWLTMYRVLRMEAAS